jgi:hypothetical protein
MKTIALSMSDFRTFCKMSRAKFTAFPLFVLCDFLGIKRFARNVDELEPFLPSGSEGSLYYIARIDWVD